jgi:purine-binding chemotaxis protein CheW
MFRVGSLLCALPLDDVVETMRPLPVKPLAGTPPYVRGVTVVRGVPVPVVDLAVLLGEGPGVEEEPDADEEWDGAARFVTVRGGRGPAAVLTGPVVGIVDTAAITSDERGPAAPDGLAADAADGDGSVRPVAAVGVRGIEPILLLRGSGLVPEAAWTALAGEARVR